MMDMSVYILERIELHYSVVLTMHGLSYPYHTKNRLQDLHDQQKDLVDMTQT